MNKWLIIAVGVGVIAGIIYFVRKIPLVDLVSGGFVLLAFIMLYVLWKNREFMYGTH